MNSELENIILTVDTREQNTRRIKAVEDWAQGHNAVVEHSALKLCDYQLLGEFRDVSVSIGIEAKSMSDFATSYGELSDKLARSYQLYDDVALFVEAGNYTFNQDPLKNDNFHMIIDNPAVHNGKADVLPLAVYENMLASFQREGIHVRQLRGEDHFPYAIAGLLISIVKPIHTGLEIKDKCWQDRELNRRAKFKGFGYKRAMKSLLHHPNMAWLCSASEDSLMQIYGMKVGKTLYDEIHCHDLETDEWRNGYHLDGTEVLMCPHEGKPCSEVNVYQCIGQDCIYHPSHQDKAITSSPSSLSCDTSKSLSRIDATKFAAPAHDTSFSHLPEDYSKNGHDTTSIPQSSGNDTISSHPSSFVTPSVKLDDPQGGLPPVNPEEKQERLSVIFSLAHTNKCINSIQEKPNQKNGHSMNLKECLKEYLKEPHTMQECVDRHKGWQSGYVFDMVMGGAQAGYLKKVTLNDKVTFQRIE